MYSIRESGLGTSVDQVDIIVSQIERLRRREQLLYDDIVIASHKGFGVTGGTEEEIREELAEISNTIDTLSTRMEEEFH